MPGEEREEGERREGDPGGEGKEREKLGVRETEKLREKGPGERGREEGERSRDV